MDLVKKVCDNSLDDNLSMERVTWFSNSMSGARISDLKRNPSKECLKTSGFVAGVPSTRVAVAGAIRDVNLIKVLACCVVLSDVMRGILNFSILILGQANMCLMCLALKLS